MINVRRRRGLPKVPEVVSRLRGARWSRPALFGVVGLILLGAIASGSFYVPAALHPKAATHAPAPNSASTERSIGLRFEPNVGQGPSGVDFVAHDARYSVSLDADTVAVAIASQPKPPAEQTQSPRNLIQAPPNAKNAIQSNPPSVVRMQLVGGSTKATPKTQDAFGSNANYLLGGLTSWLTNVPQYAKVTYFGVYPGVDVSYTGTGGQLEYTFTLAPGADPSSIRLGVDGAQSVAVDRGDLIISTPAGSLRERAPTAYQDGPNGRRSVASSFVLGPDSTVGFNVSAYDHSRSLTIDPVVDYSTYLGGSSADEAQSVATDSTGNTYVSGREASTDFPTTTGAFQTINPGLLSDDEAWVAKFSPSGSLVYSTLIGGTQPTFLFGIPSTWSSADSIAVDASGDAVIGGFTEAPDFPTTTDAFEPHPFGGPDWGFVAKFNPTGSGLLYSSYMGDDIGSSFGRFLGDIDSLTLDSSGAYYFLGTTGSFDFSATPGAFQGALKGFFNLVIIKLTPAGALQYATYLGGSSLDIGTSIAVDAAGDAYVAGGTASSDFPVTPGAFQTSPHDNTTYFVSKLNPTGTGLMYSTYLGGSTQEWSPVNSGFTDNGSNGVGLAVNSAGDAYITGGTSSFDYPVTPGAFQGNLNHGCTGVNGSSLNDENAVVSELNPAGSGLIYSTYLGGSGCDQGAAVTLQGSSAVVVGGTTSADFPTQGPTQPHQGGGPDTFVTEIAPGGDAIQFSTYLGGSGEDRPNDVSTGGGLLVVAGTTNSSDFPTLNAAQGGQHGSGNAYVTAYSLRDLLKLTQTASPASVAEGQQLTYGFTVTNDGSAGSATSVTLSDPLPSAETFVAATATQGTCSQSGGSVSCALGTVAAGTAPTVQISVKAPNVAGTVVNTGSVSAAEADPAPQDNQASTTVLVGAADMAITDSAPANVVTGQRMTYTLSVANNGPSVAHGVQVIDNLPTQQACGAVACAGFISATTSQGTCTQVGGTVTCALGTMAANAIATIRAIVAVNAPLGFSFADSATVSANEADPDPDNNTASAGGTTSNSAGCDQVITSNTKLTADIGPCADTDGLIVGADNVTLDLNGHSILGAETDASLNALEGCPCDDVAGVRLPDRVGVTLENGSISGFAAGIFINSGGNNTIQKMNINNNAGPNGSTADFSDGIFIQHSAANHVLSNTLNANGLYDQIGVFGLDADFNVIQGNTLTNGTGRGIDMAAFLELFDPRRGNALHGNRILGNTITGSDGTGISTQSNVDGQIIGNDIEKNGLDTSNGDTDVGIGVSVDENATPTAQELIENNKVIGNGEDGIQLNAKDNRILNNTAEGNSADFGIGNAFELDDRTSNDCSTNTWTGNTYGPAGVNPACLALTNTSAGVAGPRTTSPSQVPAPTTHERHEVR